MNTKLYMRYLLLVYTLLLCSISQTLAQQLLFTNVTEKIGAPSYKCYNIMQDSKGYIWASTENGLCRYNGKKVTVFNKSNGLHEGATYTVNEDSDGTIWITTSKNRILKFEKGVLAEAHFSNAYTGSMLTDNITYQVYTNEPDQLHLTSSNSTYIINKETNTISAVKRSDSAFYYFNLQENLYCINSTSRTYQKTKNYNKGYIVIRKGDKVLKIPIKHKTNELISYRVITHTNRNSFLFVINNMLYEIDKKLNYKVHQLPARIISLYTDKEDGLWVGMYQGGVYYYKDGDIGKNKTHSLISYSVSGICEDHENGIWCTTLEKGIFYSNNKKVLSYNNILKQDRQAEMLKNVSGKIIVSVEPGRLTVLPDRDTEKHDYFFKTQTPINDIIAIKNKWLLGGRGFIIWADKQFKPIRYFHFSNKKILYSTQVVEANNNRTFSLAYNNLQEIKDEQVFDIARMNDAIKNTFFIGNNTLLLGLVSGLYSYNTQTGRIVNYKTIKSEIVKIISAADSTIWIATKNDGLYQISQDTLVNIKQHFQIKADIIYDLEKDQSNNLWVGTNSGLIKITFTNKDYKTIKYNTTNGLPDNEIYHVALNSQNVYISTVNGIFKFPLKEDFSNNSEPQIHLRNIKINDVLYYYKNVGLNIPYDSNSFKIAFDILSFKSDHRKKIYYTLNGNDHSQTFNDDNEIILSNLKPGQYNLVAYGVNSDGIKSKSPVKINFSIRQPVWLTPLFLIFVVSASIAVVYLIIIYSMKKIQRKEEEKTHINTLIAESQLSALQAQMNPHFIFNAINSIQNYILKNEAETAYNYLAKFSKLIRLVLNNSQEKTITLNNELETIKLYVTLEQMRFKHSFDFEVNIADEVDIHELQVPVMLVQPYIENAIWHGLMPLDGIRRGLLVINVSYEHDLLKFTIADNGIGRSAANELQKEKVHRPIALKLTARRLDIIHKMQGYEGVNVIIVDLKDTNDKPVGTQVDVLLPITYNGSLN